MLVQWWKQNTKICLHLLFARQVIINSGKKILHSLKIAPHLQIRSPSISEKKSVSNPQVNNYDKKSVEILFKTLFHNQWRTPVKFGTPFIYSFRISFKCADGKTIKKIFLVTMKNGVLHPWTLFRGRQNVAKCPCLGDHLNIGQTSFHSQGFALVLAHLQTKVVDIPRFSFSFSKNRSKFYQKTPQMIMAKLHFNW